MQPNLKKGHRLELSICFYSNCIELVVQKPSAIFFKLIIATTFLNYSCVVWDRKAKFAEEFAVLVTLQSTAMDWARNVRLTNSSEVDPNVTSSQEVSDIVSSANAFPKGNSATGYNYSKTKKHPKIRSKTTVLCWINNWSVFQLACFENDRKFETFISDWIFKTIW